MAGANSNIQVTELDFNNIKSSLRTYLQSQDVLKDYNYEGSALSSLLDILAYNTQYNAYYLNMVANEMFLDSSLQRSSVVSHAKLLNYVPKSALAPTSQIRLSVNQVTDSSLTLPKFTRFISEAIDGVNYTFVTTDTNTVNVVNNTATFDDLHIKQGLPATLTFTVDSINNPKYLFEIPDQGVDTTTLSVTVQQSGSNSSSEAYSTATNFLTLTPDSKVYFLQENLKGNYEIYFGDDILGKKLSDGNVVIITYVITKGTASAGSNNFVLMDSVGGYANTVITPLVSATQGGNKESIESIKFQAPKSYSAQGRAVSKNDYITLIQQNELGYSFDAVNVWGGEENIPPVYGQVFVCLKPTGSYLLTDTQKRDIVTEVIKPISVLTVSPTIVDPDYTYIKVNATVVYNPTKTSYSSSQLNQIISSSIRTFGNDTLNTFNSTFLGSQLTSTIQVTDPSIITSELKIQLQKKFNPDLTVSKTYSLNFNTPLQKGILLSGINSSPAIQQRNPTTLTEIIQGIYIEEVPSASGGIASVSIVNPGFNYTYVPTITIYGDGTGATAEAVINTSGRITKINVTNPGIGYTSAVVTVTPNAYDTTGLNGAAAAILEGQFGTLRSYYYNSNNVKTIFNGNVGTVDYVNGIVTLVNFNPYQIDNPLGQLTISVVPTSTIVNSSYNKIITIDEYDSNAVNVSLIAKAQ
jgi:hypothetical protein